MGSMVDEAKTAEAAADAARDEQDGGVPDRLTLSTGAVLKLKPVPQAVIRRVAAKIERPAVPVVHIEDKDRDEPNPDDPDYKEAVVQWVTDQALAAFKAVLLLGTEIEIVPEGMDRPEDIGWTAVLLHLGIVTEEELGDPYQRYLAWVELYAARTETDIFGIARLPVLLAGISESEVMDAILSFRGATGRGADNGSAPAAGGDDRDHLPRAVRRARARAGGKGGGKV